MNAFKGGAAAPVVPRESFRDWIARTAPTFLVVACLGGIAYAGHHTGWKVPKFEDLFGSSAAKDDWCDEHSVPESICVECDDTRMPRIKSTWCRKHGVHNCPFERVDVVQTKSTPIVSGEDLLRADRALQLKERKANNQKCKLHHRRIQFASQEAMDKMGIDIQPVSTGPIVETVSASGELAFDQPRVAPVSAPVAGRMWHVTEKGVQGVRVKRGELLALVDAIEVGKAKGELLQAFAQSDLRKRMVDMLKPLVPAGAASQVQLQEAELGYREARIRLMVAERALANLGMPIHTDEMKVATVEELAARLTLFGLPADLASRFDAKATTGNLLPLMAPRDGVVVAVKAASGELVEPGRPLFVVADTSRMWLHLHVRSEDARYLRIRDEKTGTKGHLVKFRPDGSDDEVVGELTWKSTEVDEITKTVKYRVDLPNPDGSLLANSYGSAQVVIRQESDAIVIPNEALHWEGDCHIAFVRDKDFLEDGAKKVFHVRSVRPGVKQGANTEIIAGVLPGEVIATTNSAAMRAELLKNNLGAG
ncbi:MAG: efflux RND transporter periplasmic adaptor subunit [Gemmataceae bacterium]